MKIRKKLYYAISLLSALSLSACGGGGGGGSNNVAYSGPTTPVAITANNAQSVGSGAAEGVTQAVDSNNTNQSIPLAASASGSTSTESLAAVVADIGKAVVSGNTSTSAPVAATLTSDQLNSQAQMTIYCGGSVTYPDNYTGSGPLTMSFNNLCIDMSAVTGSGLSGQWTLNGSMTIDSNSSTGVTSITYSNVTISGGGQTYTLNGSFSCDSTGCSFSQDFVSSSGATYRVSNVSVTGDSTGYYVSATFYHPDYGSVTVSTTSPIVFGCSSGYPSSGTVSFTGASGSSGTITFRSDCTGYDGTYTTSTGSTGTFSGNWPA